jgi:hypothetical protein
LNYVNKIDLEKYQLLKKLLTGHETDESEWKKWIKEISKFLPSPYDLENLNTHLLSCVNLAILDIHLRNRLNISS